MTANDLMMKRRTLLKYTSLSIASSLVAACTHKVSQPVQTVNQDFGKLEKTALTLAYIPTLDAAPLIIAQEKGFFSRYGLTVTLSKQTTWKDIEKGLLTYRFDAAQALYGMPILAQLNTNFAPLIALMGLNLNGGAITLSQKAWQAGIRPSFYYTNFSEFADGYRNYIRTFKTPPSLGIESKAAPDHYLYRYWLAAMGIDPDREVQLTEITPSQMIYKLQAGLIQGYTASDPWNQQVILDKTGFIPYINRDIWKGYPNKILAAMQPWADKNPATAKALIASLIEACQFCEKTENQLEIVKILSQNRYLNIDSSTLKTTLIGKYNYGKLEGKSLIKTTPEFIVFYKTKAQDRANYLWLSDGIWLLTQMIRWQQINRQEYPKNADKLLEKMYPITLYEEVAKALKIPLPKERIKKEAASEFIDKRAFDPSQPVSYLNQFEIRASRPQIFALS